MWVYFFDGLLVYVFKRIWKNVDFALFIDIHWSVDTCILVYMYPQFLMHLGFCLYHIKHELVEQNYWYALLTWIIYLNSYYSGRKVQWLVAGFKHIRRYKPTLEVYNVQYFQDDWWLFNYYYIKSRSLCLFDPIISTCTVICAGTDQGLQII